MSIVGPRPEQIELVERYRPEHRFRLDVKPGMTGPMQVFGRGELTFSERLAVELDYVENLSLARDLRILLQTIPARPARPRRVLVLSGATVIVPTARGGQGLARLLASLRAESGVEETLVVANGVPDAALMGIDGTAERIRVIRLPQNVGLLACGEPRRRPGAR